MSESPVAIAIGAPANLLRPPDDGDVGVVVGADDLGVLVSCRP